MKRGENMGNITISIPDHLEHEFRHLTRKKFGDRNGKLSKGAVEALTAWCNEEKREIMK